MVRQRRELLKSKFLRDLFSTAIAQIGVFLLVVMLLKIMVMILDKEYFGVFMIIRRVVSLLSPIFSLGLGDSLSRYASLEEGKERVLFSSSVFLVGGVFAIMLMVAHFFRLPLSDLFFGSRKYEFLIPFLSVFLGGLGMYLVAYSFFRGKREMRIANRLQYVYYFSPIVFAAFLWKVVGSGGQFLVCYLLLYGMLGIGIVLIVGIKLFSLSKLLELEWWKYFVRNMLVYGLARIPSKLLLAAILAVPVLVASHRLSLVSAAYVGVAIFVLRIMELFISPFFVLLLPNFAALLKQGDMEEINHRIEIVIDFLLSFVLAFVVVLYGLPRYLVVWFLGKGYLPAIEGVRVVILFSYPYLVYRLLGGIMDALFFFPYVSVICTVAVLVTTVLSFSFYRTVVMLVYDLGLGFSIMGILSLWILLKKSRIVLNKKTLCTYLLSIAVSWTVLYVLDGVVVKIIADLYFVVGVMITVRIVIILGLLLLWKRLGSLWISEVIDRIGWDECSSS